MRRLFAPLALLSACATTRPDAARLVPAEVTRAAVFTTDHTPVRTVTDRADLDRLVACLAQAEPLADDAPRPAWTHHVDLEGPRPAQGRWLYAAGTGEIAPLQVRARPRGRLVEAARACVAPFLAPTP